ncbi:MAG: 4Fe-4S dicluster domain-containing protein [Desulfovibrionaceae bacterium]|nr:4Fe-4S dicluster domain-containing protein [Desulfovibrionaceae bacterium]
MARYVMAIDSARCMNCKACVIACQQRNEVPYDISRNWVRETPDPASPCGTSFQPGACMHCDDPSCVRACPTHATWKARNGAVEIDRGRCIGCGSCIDACPYHARFRHPVTGTADKCDYCHGSTPGMTPACVSVCPVHCRVFGDADDPSSEVTMVLAGHKPVHLVPQGSGAKPTLTYLDATVPDTLPAGPVRSMPIDTMRPMAKGLTWVGGLVLAALTGTFVRQLLWPSEKEDQELADEELVRAKKAAEDRGEHRTEEGGRQA